MMEQLFHICS